MTGENRAANLTAMTMAAMPVGWIVYSWGIYANIFAEGMLTLLFALLVLSYRQLAGPYSGAWTLLFALVICLTLLAHLGVLVLTAAVVALYGLARLVEAVTIARRGDLLPASPLRASSRPYWRSRSFTAFRWRRCATGKGTQTGSNCSNNSKGPYRTATSRVARRRTTASASMRSTLTTLPSRSHWKRGSMPAPFTASGRSSRRSSAVRSWPDAGGANGTRGRSAMRTYAV